jgi:very-short-patch-repair endonuclease
MRGAEIDRTERSRRLRRDSTDAEHRLWYRLRARRLGGHKFVRQEPIGPFIVDFVCRERRLVIEVDGSQHAESKRDAARDKWLVDHGYRVLRFWNNEVFGNIDGVLETIVTALAVDTPPHPDPLPASGEREKQGRDA